MCTAPSGFGLIDCIRRPERVQWGPMTDDRVAAIIIIP
jgi:hypothetical protein